jgi:hypothetical protein
MDTDYITDFHRKFEENDIICRCELVLEDINRYVRKRNPVLTDATHLLVKESLRSVLHLCGIGLTKTTNSKQKLN